MAWARGTSFAIQMARSVPWTRQRRRRGDGLGRPADGLVQLVGLDHLRDEPDLVGPLGGHPLVGAEQRHAQHLLERHLLEHLDGLVGGRHLEGHVRVEEGGAPLGDDEVALPEQVEGAAAGHAPHRGDDRLPQLVGLGPQSPTRVVEDPGRRVPEVPVGRAGRRRRWRRGRCPRRRRAPRRRSSTTQRTSSSLCSAGQSEASSSSIWRLKALRTSGRLRVTQAMPSSISHRIVSNVVIGSA